MARGAPLIPRLTRLAQKRSLREIGRAARRATRRELASRRVELGLRRAAHDGKTVVLGPFLGEVGFELLYWVPMARRLMARHGIGPSRVVALTRGGAGEWYRDFAARSLEIFDLVELDVFRRELAERRARTGDAKMLSVESFDRRLLEAARTELGPIIPVHPILMFTRLRWIWQGAQNVSEIRGHGDYRLLRVPSERPSVELPEEYVAVKAYFSDCFPDEQANRSLLARLVERLAEMTDVVLLSARPAVDDHEPWEDDGAHHRVVRVDLSDPRHNLALQSRAVAGARALVSTYGGFSYLGPFYGIPTVALRSTDAFNPLHLEVLRVAMSEPEYHVVTADEVDKAVELVSRALARSPAGQR
jgi:hypothetical protein